MSGFGRPPSKVIFSPTPPERGSFPLDHEAALPGECRSVMTTYLACLKKAKGTNDMACRLIAKDYLKCRMDHQLMAVDEFKNLGFQEEAPAPVAAKVAVGGKGSRLDELRRENEELKRQHREEDRKAAAAAGEK
ncbi:uncharacterized protein H6S33_007458 [Morchella sextelata]|uniref:uncharacterized protein n=1 Tax=Morchella sextelata TaxID=1174677 RepID=UPI001D043701|nr:uncharacterized protein H6S33_007458 [Morchella sextelata]KAH0603799.1 hypothetical protein H6S33_007458 [Morchella sextelata]